MTATHRAFRFRSIAAMNDGTTTLNKTERSNFDIDHVGRKTGTQPAKIC